MTYFKHEEKHRATLFAHVLTTVEFDGKSAHVVASVKGTESDIGVVRVDTEMVPATEGEWDAAVKEMHKLRSKKRREDAKAREATELAERFGLPVHLHRDDRVLYVTRVTRTSIFTSGGERWTRKHGGRIGDANRWARPFLTDDSMKTIRAFVGKRETVDIIAERQAANDSNPETTP